EDFTQWTARQIPRSAGLELMFPETTLMDQGDQLVAMVRTNTTTTAPVAISRDHGHSWTALGPSNFPIDNSKTFCGRLSTGQHFYISNSREEGRGLLTIAVTRPGEKTFRTIWKLRHQHYPVRRLFPGWTDGINGSLDMVGSTTEWSYPAAIEHDGKLYISYTQGKEDCVLSIIPIDVLAVEE
ncbi:MAG TPA: exo-alpha-sialidase, partial [Armatimonadota bacterium]|nr:exo-alpha-sialidase [Armatimonadota bacterium]